MLNTIQHVNVSCSHLVMFVIAALCMLLFVEINDCFVFTENAVFLF